LTSTRLEVVELGAVPSSHEPGRLASALGLPQTSGRRTLLAATAIDATGSGLFLPFGVVFFVATTSLGLAEVGAALSLAALVALPAPTVIGPLVDRFGPRRVVACGNLVSALGFGGYLLVETAWQVVLAALLVNLGTAMFWTSSGALVGVAADPGERPRWFGLLYALRNAGTGLGGLLAAALLGGFGPGGYTMLAAGNGVTYLLAGLLVLAWRPPEHPDRPDPVAGVRPVSAGGYLTVVRDLPFAALVTTNVFFVLSAMVLPVLLALYITGPLDGPAWAAGALLTVNTAMIALGQTSVARRIERRDRVAVIRLGAAVYVVAFACFALLIQVPAGLLVVGLVVSMVVFTLAEMAETTAMSDLVVSMAPNALRGRYQAVFQLSWSVGIAAAPVLFTSLLAVGAAVPWLVLLGGAVAAVLALGALRGRVPEGVRHGGDRDTARAEA